MNDNSIRPEVIDVTPKEAVQAETEVTSTDSKPLVPQGEEIKEVVEPVDIRTPEQRRAAKNGLEGYTIEDPAFGEFNVLPTENGWWVDRTKLEKLLDAYKIDATDAQALFYAGLTDRQLQYFQELHPDFVGIKRRCGENLALVAKTHIAKEIKDNSAGRPSWYLERREKKTYSTRVEHTGADGKDLVPLNEEQQKKLDDLLNKTTDVELGSTKES